VDLGVLKLRRRGQHDVGVVHGVGWKLLVHHDEQIVAHQALVYTLQVGRDRCRITVIDEQRLDRRVIQFGERLAQLVHVDRARAGRNKVGPF
jgi:hypothetical protein